MKTQTFEQAFKNEFKETFQAMLSSISDKKILVSNDITVKPLENDPDRIVAVLQSGKGRKQEVKGFDLTTYPLVLTIIVDMNFLQDLLAILNNYIALNNGIVKQLTYQKNESETGSFDYIIRFDTPNQIGSPVDLKVKNRNVKVAMVMLAGEIKYTTTADISLPGYWLKITKSDTTTLEAKVEGDGVINQDSATVPEYELFYTYDLANPLAIPICLSTAITFQITQLKANEMHQLLERVADGQETITKVEYKTLNPLDTYKEYRYQITHSYSDGIKVFDLTLTR